jgi:hypothetical protein
MYAQDLLKGLTVYNRLSSAGQVRKQIWKLVAIHAMGQELESELRIWALIRSPDEFETSLEEAKALAKDAVGRPGSRVAVRPRMDIEAGKRPRKNVPMRVNAMRKKDPMC